MDTKGKIILTGAISFLLGLGAGGAGMYFYSKRYFRTKCDEELQQMGEYYILKYNPEKEEKDESSNEKKGDDEVGTEEESKVQDKYEAISDIYKSKQNESDKAPTSYSKCFNGDNSDSSNTGKKKGGRKKKVDIEIVDQEIWDENPGGLDSRFLVYYDADSVLIDEESEKPFEENNDIVKMIDLHSDDTVDDVLILQDNTGKCLYHVTVERMAYSEQLDD